MNPLAILDQLKERPNPKTKKEFTAIVGKQPEIPETHPIFESDIGESDTGKPIIEPVEKSPFFIDRRDKVKIDRQHIMNRLQGFTGYPQPIVISSDKKTTIDKEIDIDILKRKQPVFESVGEKKKEEKEEKGEEEIMKVKKIKKLKIIGEEDEGEKEEREEREEKPIIEEVGEIKEEPEKEVKPKIRITKKPKKEEEIDIGEMKVLELEKRLPKEQQKHIIRAPTYYMNNRRLFIQKIEELLRPYRSELDNTDNEVSCDTIKSSGTDIELMAHQRIVRDYLNLYTPYRGLLIYHGLGSGKTCTSIAIAEGMKTNKHVFVMTRASLKTNFLSELKKCGDEMYRKNYYWEFVDTSAKPQLIAPLARVLSLETDYVRRNGGAWLVDIRKEANYANLSGEEQKKIDQQLEAMIRAKYTNITFTMQEGELRTLSGNFSRNPFDNCVVIVDEVHNIANTITNKIKDKNRSSVIMRIYDYIMSAQNAKIVFLSGTPIINYPNEIAVLFNMLRGYIKTWRIPITVTKRVEERVNKEFIMKILEKEKFRFYDYLEYSGDNLIITRNPFGFVNEFKRDVDVKKGGAKREKKSDKNDTAQIQQELENYRDYRDGIEGTGNVDTNFDDDFYKDLREAQNTGSSNPFRGGATTEERYKGVTFNELGQISDQEMIDRLVAVLGKHGLEVTTANIKLELNKSLPDGVDAFINTFVNPETGILQNVDLFQRRVLGLTSYFRSAQEQLFPRYNQETDFIEVKVPMSDYQFTAYSVARGVERERDKKNRRKAGLVEDLKTSTSYRSESRSICNFAYPDPPGKPKKIYQKGKNVEGEGEEDIEVPHELGNLAPEEEVAEANEKPMAQDKKEIAERYESSIRAALQYLYTHREECLTKEGLSKYSPKMLHVLENIEDAEHTGLHLVYSNFLTQEGIGIMKLILQTHGYTEFKLGKDADGEWYIEDTETEESGASGKRFVLYTGNETAETKEMIRNIYNSNWGLVPDRLREQLTQIASNNYYGEIIKVFMITASGAEGISLENTRYVHILEPYWNWVRIEQVIGRARRICSHRNLPVELQTVRVFFYMSVLSEEQKSSDKNIELVRNDVSRRTHTPISSDEYLYEIARMKQDITRQIMKAVKETAMDCSLHRGKNQVEGEEYVCYDFGKVKSNQFSSYPTLEQDATENKELNVKRVEVAMETIEIKGVKYLRKKGSAEIYDFEEPSKLIGRLIKVDGKYKLQKE